MGHLVSKTLGRPTKHYWVKYVLNSWAPPFTLMKATNRWKSVMEVRDDSWNCATYGRFYKQNLSSVLGPKDLVLLCMEYFASPR